MTKLSEQIEPGLAAEKLSIPRRRQTTAVPELSTTFGVGHAETCGGWYGNAPNHRLDDRYCTCKSADGSTPLERARWVREMMDASSHYEKLLREAIRGGDRNLALRLVKENVFRGREVEDREIEEWLTTYGPNFLPLWERYR